MLPAFKLAVAAAAIAASIGVAKADDCALLASYGFNCVDIDQMVNQANSGNGSNSYSQTVTVTQSE